MIRVLRGAVPGVLVTHAMHWTTELCQARSAYYRDLAIFHRAGSTGPRPRRPNASSGRYAHDGIRAALESMFGSKCAYCETFVRASSPQHVEHYRPQSIFPALAYDWDNLLLSCPECNTTHKSVRFPIAPTGNTPTEHRRTPCVRTAAGHTPLLLDPCRDDPATHLTFQNGRVVALTERGLVTRRVCGLNREHLIQDRLEWLRMVKVVIEAYKAAKALGDQAHSATYRAHLREVSADHARYAAMVRAELLRSGIDWQRL